MLTIGLIDNYALMRMGLAVILHGHFEHLETLEANNLEDFDVLHLGKHPDVIVMGINLVTMEDCLDRAGELKSRFPSTPVIIYDGHPCKDLTISYFELGINGYLLKQSPANEMIESVEAVLSNRKYLCPIVLETLLTCAETIHKPAKRLSLTHRESEIAKYLSQGMTTSWIAKELGRKASTVSTIKRNIFKKMNVDNILHLRTAIHMDFA